ncbi:hypothetical protein [Flavobacterium granuli]|uniref:KTSC domain-containing protein n=1 Tax=Flavobacterium granuli TaxID=280093 RepID=A0ABU1S0C0_9FLAO|nr:hypothetical protein [Flavobacterium granuli]MDR6844480.1 hypothetical protein [Flavobacterium granuli]
MKKEVKILEVEHIDMDGRDVEIEMLDGNVVRIGKNVQDFYFKLLKLPVGYRCKILQLNIDELQNFIKEHTKYYNQKLISEFKKKWVWLIDSEVYDFSDKEINEEFFGVSLDKKQILGKLKRNSFDTTQVFKMLDFFKENDDIKEDYEE